MAAIGTGAGAAGGGLFAAWLGYLYAAAAFPDQEFVAIPIIVFGAFGGGIVAGALACWIVLRVAGRVAAGGTALRALAFLIMLAPALLLGTPALKLDRAGGIALAGIAAAAAGAVARLLTPEREAPRRRDPGESPSDGAAR
jgi:hypothetical protein